MMNEQIIVEKLIEKFRFEEPVNPPVRNYIAESKERNLKRILKNESKYGIFTAAAVVVFFLARKAGLTISFINAAIITGSVAAVTTAAIIAGSVSGVNYIIEKNRAVNEIPAPVIEIPEMKPSLQSVKPVSVYRFSGTPGSSKIADRATGIIYKRLIAEHGEDNVFLSSFSANKGYLVTGSVEKLQSGYLITMKIVDPVRGVILNMETAEISNEDELPAVCNRLVKIISRSTR
jgi:hypothetical protein